MPTQPCKHREAFQPIRSAAVIAAISISAATFAPPLHAQQNPRDVAEEQLTQRQMQQLEEMADPDIADAVRSELGFDSAIIGENIDVAVTDGRVRLRGQVDNLPARRRAVRIAETVRGVRAVEDLLDVAPLADRSDIEIREDVEAAFIDLGMAEGVEVVVDDGVVKLGGTVDSRMRMDALEIAASDVVGVIEVVNAMDLDKTAERPAEKIRSDITESMRWNDLVDDAQINVTVSDGVVALSGLVGSAAERTQAIEAAKVEGVSAVDAGALQVQTNTHSPEVREQLQQDKYKNITPRGVARAVNRALANDPTVRAGNIRVLADDGEVRLRGTVHTIDAARTAGRVARNIVGVQDVINELDVRPDVSLTSEVIASNIEQRLARDPYLSDSDVGVTFVDGTATLTGLVDTLYEQVRADDIAARVEGVKRVVNALQVEADETPWVFNPYTDASLQEDYDWYSYEPASTTKSDTEIRTAIKEQLESSAIVNANNVMVSVDNGRATLTGDVTSRKDRLAAIENAYEGGATVVIDELVVGGSQPEANQRRTSR